MFYAVGFVVVMGFAILGLVCFLRMLRQVNDRP